MALVNCTECGAEVSHEAGNCPACGIKHPILSAEQRLNLDQSTRQVSIAIFFVVLIGAIAIFKTVF